MRSPGAAIPPPEKAVGSAEQQHLLRRQIVEQAAEREYFTLTEPVTKAVGRRAFLRVRLQRDADDEGAWTATLAGGQGSHVLSALAHADGLAIVPETVDSLPAGAQVEVIRP